MIHIYNSLSKQKELFIPINPPKVGLYVCGITVYDYCHIGHARVMVAFDTIVRHLRSRGFEVNYVRNITDIDDKIIQRSIENGESIQTLTERFTTSMHEDEDTLNVLRPDQEPKATEYIQEITDLIQTLINKGYAYHSHNGDVYFDVSKYAKYGQLSGKQTENLITGKRVKVNQDKNNPLDFVLWKAAKPEEPQWDTKLGCGRPGWHIECSAMSKHTIGEHLDIHGGGHDLQFPHHENEIAQSECAHNHTYVNTWMHVGFVNVNGEKMSKSLGNFFTIRDVLTQYSAQVVRMFLLSSHYRNPINYSTENLELAKNSIQRLYDSLETVDIIPAVEELKTKWYDLYNAAMDDDFNTPAALAVLFHLAKEINLSKLENDKNYTGQLTHILISLAEQLGFILEKPVLFDEYVLTKIKERNLFKQQGKYHLADKIREELSLSGIVLKDLVDKTIWTKIN